MELSHWYNATQSNEAEGIYQLYGPDILHNLDSAIFPRDKAPLIGHKINLFRIAYPVIKKRSMGDGQVICSILKNVHALINQHISKSELPCCQSWYLDHDGQIIIQILDENNQPKGEPSNMENYEPTILSFLLTIENDVENNKIAVDKTYKMNIIAMAKSQLQNIDEGRELIKLISMVSQRVDAMLQNICADHPEIGGSQDWYVAECGSIMMELYVSKK